jgi:hypothetical protein
MAEHASSGHAELGAPMDYREHERTYSGFISLSKIGVLASIASLLSLALFSFGGGWGFWWGFLILFLMLAGTAIGIVGNGNVRPLIAVSVLGFILLALTTA